MSCFSLPTKQHLYPKTNGYEEDAVTGGVNLETMSCIKQVEHAVESSRVYFCHLWFQYNLLFLQKQDEPELAIACPDSLMNDKETAENITATITSEYKCPSNVDIPIASQHSGVRSPLRTKPTVLVPRVEYFKNPWLDPLIWEKICALFETSVIPVDSCVLLSNRKLKIL